MRYDELIKEVGIYKPKTILEIGSFRCARAERMVTEAIKHAGNAQEITYIGFDLFQDLDQEFRLYEGMGKVKQPDQSLCEDKLRKLGCQYQLVKGNTRDTLATFMPTKKIDFVFVDGGHSIDTIKSDWANLKRICQPGCVVYFDDYYPGRTDMGCLFLESRLIDYQVSFLDSTDEERLEGSAVKIMKVII